MIRQVIVMLAAVMTCSACIAQEDSAVFGPPTATDTLVVRSTTDINVFAPVMQDFLATRPNMAIAYEQWGSNDLAALSARHCASGADSADLIISSAADLQVQLVNDGCAIAYKSPATEALPTSRNWRNEIFGITEEPAVLIYNTELVAPDEVPLSRFDLIDLLRPADSRFVGRVATYDIEASGLGYLFAFMDSLQANTFGRLLEAFGRSGAVATCCSAELIDAVADGRYLIAYNVLGSYALARADKDARIGVRAPSDYTLVLSRTALIPKHSNNVGAAGAFIDFLLSGAGQTALGQARLVVKIGGADGSDFDLPGGGPSSLRPIALSPILLAGLDQHKRKIFLSQWRQNLRQK
ncbi:ABC transporter substrate-binding protein [Devosia rhodophyticola]|uniref:ABC transporter substrate-binding protein n=1 Tax=Devosia rhodophyticola TaxID=3026423 RepID=A0ABY7YZZ6_9HYPH|nr:ABC transporter substrate-binding protein [Devosia rhodophyticola]WDR06948.1 ABC transporter substrate-binding protein [Devosia rhodophyticola]